ncbi:MAG: 4Fe-4S dicluster domain-containing protein [archaeon]
MGKLLKKEDFNLFLLKLKSKGKLIAPVKRDILRFEVIDDVKDICLEGLPWFPIKKFFMPSQHKLMGIEKKNPVMKFKAESQIIFGAKACDLNAIERLDKLFMDDIPDLFYQQAREKSILIGIHCAEPVDEYCFCEDMGLKQFYDLMFYDLGDSYYIHVGSEKGRKLVSKFKDHQIELPKIKTKKHMKKINISNYFDDANWTQDQCSCLSCGKCTLLCPSCLCFDVECKPELDGQNGSVERLWDSCHFKDFTEVAGGHVFRESRVSRYKHRVFHKIQYFKDEFGDFMCTGCGRCIRICPRKIDFVDTINKLR